MTEEHRMILEMLKNGNISAEEAEKLIDAVPEWDEPQDAINTSDYTFEPKSLSVKVSERGQQKVNVKLPFSLVRVALRLGQSFGGIAKRYLGENEAAAVDMLNDINIDEILQSVGDGTLTLPLTLVDVYVDEGQVGVLVALE